MNTLTEAFQQFLTSESEQSAPLDILYRFYAEYLAIDTEITRTRFQSLEPHMEQLSMEDQNAVMDALCIICTEQEKTAFTHGVRLGAQLTDALKES